MTPVSPARIPVLLLVPVLLAAAGLRLYLAWQAHVPTIDTAVVGQMALEILDGDRPAFFAGQSYMGALEAYLLAAVFVLVPAGRVTMTFVTIGFALAWIVATFFLFRRQYGGWAALAAALVPAFPGWPAMWYTTAPYGGYPQTYLFGTLLLLLALPFLDRRDFAPSLRHAVALALLAGLALWTNLQVLPYLAAAGAAGLWAWTRRPRPLLRWLPYVCVPVAAGLALVPQWLAEPSHVEPPLFGGLSLKVAARSLRAFLHYDLPHSVLWNHPPDSLHRTVAILLTVVVAGGLWLAFRAARRRTGPPATTLLVLFALAVFALTYFPHPMSGYVPRYFNAPVTLLLSWSLALWASAPAAWIRRAGLAAALLLAAYNATHTIRCARIQHIEARQTLEYFASAIEAAREGGWTAVMHSGSEIEGYDGARLTFLAGGDPVFASAFSDRFIDHQLEWEFADHAGYLAPLRHLPFVEGSLSALNVPVRGLRIASPYALLDAPEVARRQERSRLPDSIADHAGPVERHPLFDRSATTGWPDAAAGESVTLTLHFQEPVGFSGLRVSGPEPLDLPYRGTVRVQTPDGEWVTVQHTEQRIAATYLSGTRVYFRGYHPWMDVRFEPVVGTALEWTILPGPANPAPPRLYDLHVLEAHGAIWPDWDDIMIPIQAALQAAPEAVLVAERGVQRALHRGIDAEPLRRRIPLPYNPRFGRTRPERFPLVAGDYLLVVEEAYLAAARTVFEGAGVVIENEFEAGPFRLLSVSVDATTTGRTAWHGFQPVALTAPAHPAPDSP